MSTTRKLGIAAALLIASQLLSRLLGFGRDAFIAAVFGANGSTDAFIAMIDNYSAGQTVTLTVKRSGQTMQIKVKLGVRPSASPAGG